jgi:hypothetical protein
MMIDPKPLHKKLIEIYLDMNVDDNQLPLSKSSSYIGKKSGTPNIKMVSVGWG